MRVIIYTKRDCVYCDYTKNLLEVNKISYQNLILNEDFTREHLLELFPSSKTFPVITVDGFNVGGYDNLKLILEQKTETRKLLNEGN
jgi:glutaredoxin